MNLRALRPSFPGEIDRLYRQSLRKRMRIPRVLVFGALAIAYALWPLYVAPLHAPDAAIASVLTWVACGIVAPLCVVATALTLSQAPVAWLRAGQTAAFTAVLVSLVAFRYLALKGHLTYPPQMAGIVLVGMSFIGGFAWQWIAVATAATFAASGAQEILLGQDGATLSILYSFLLLAVTAVLGSFVQDLLFRWMWWDLTRLRKTRAVLQDTEARFHAFLEYTPSIAWIKDDQGRYVMRNKAHRDRYGEPGEDWTGRADRDFFPPVDAAIYSETDARVLKTGLPAHFETSNRDRSGRMTEWWVQKFPIRDAAGRVFVAGVGVDVTERKRLERELRESENRLQAFLDHNPAISWVKDTEGRYQYMSPVYRKVLGVGEDQWKGRTDFDFYPEEFARRCREIEQKVLESGVPHVAEGRAPLSGASEHHWLLTRFLLTDASGRTCLGGVATDVTSRKRAEDIVREQALTDEMTGLYNRRGFRLLAEQQLLIARRAHGECALLYVDLDGLKSINESHGHKGGDLAITSVAEALRHAVRAADIVGRVGGDEFVVMAIDCGDADGLRGRIEAQIEGCNTSGTLPFRIAVSVGVAKFGGEDIPTFDQLMDRADAGMYERKRGKRAADAG